LGFLVHNWHPARIFLGDVGSAFLGFTFAVIPLLAGAEHSGKSAPLPLIGVLLVWLFVFDTGLTFFSRLIRRQKVWTPHREHLYQRLIISGFSHSAVSLLYGVLSITIVLSLILAMALRGHFEMILLALIVVETVGLVIFASTRKILT
jgi:UDP-N-acetylmuramyl pentapeptide phosphotransferase/UDP-N-acetylglucosamine-1-phosphate transferase